MLALRVVQRFRDRWEDLEKENLKSDVDSKFERQEFDRSYKENFEPQDQNELERVVDDAINNAASAEEDEPLSDEARALVGHKSRFLRIIATFYAPQQAAQYRAKLERLEKERMKS